MIIGGSKKIFNNYKSDFPGNTIRKISAGFSALGLKVQYSPLDSSLGYSGRASILYSLFGANGKGSSEELAQASAYAELAERFSSGMFFNMSIPTPDIQHQIFRGIINGAHLLEKFNNGEYLDGYDNRFPNEADERTLLNLLKNQRNKHQLAANLITEECTKHWSTAYDLMKEGYVSLPHNLIRRLCGSNGLAAGNSHAEAIVQGCCEIFERHALIQTIKYKEKIRRISKNTIRNDYIRTLISMYKNINYDIDIYDYSLNNTIPVIGVLFVNNNIKDDRNKIKRSLFYKHLRLGSSININDAIIRCFNEEIQGNSLTDMKNRENWELIWDYWLSRKKKYNPRRDIYSGLLNYRYPFREEMFLDQSDISIDDIRSFDHFDFVDDIEVIKEICRTMKWDIYIMNHTHKVIDFPTVRVVIPGISDTLAYHKNSQNIIHLIKEWFDIITFPKAYDYISHSSWIHNKESTKLLIENLERYLERRLSDYDFSLNIYGLPNLNAFELLERLYFLIGNYHEYSLLSKLNRSRTVIKTDQSPFLNYCQCQECRFDIPRTRYQMIMSFFAGMRQNEQSLCFNSQQGGGSVI